MKILAIDPAINLGWASGDGRSVPASGTVRLVEPGYEREDLPASAASLVRSQIREFKPDIIVIEAYMNARAQPAQAVIETSLLIHGAICGIVGIYKIPFAITYPQEWRKSFCGKANAGDRKATKAMSLDRAKQLGWLHENCRDDNRADALGIWTWAQSTYAKFDPEHRPKLELFR